LQHQVGDLVWDRDEQDLGILLKIWTEEELIKAGEEYTDYHYEIYFPASEYRDRYRKIEYMKQNLVEVLVYGRPSNR
jgi:hypothetical protein